MINDTEGVCLLENLDHDLSMNVENSEQHLLLQDPYDSVWLKIIAFFSYLIGLIASAIMLAFINYEKGHHGNFRTVINQLLSNFYTMVSFKCYYLIFRVRGHPSYHISVNSFCPWIVSALYLRPNSKMNSFSGNYSRKYGILIFDI